jgi:hypothetical protein
MFLINYKAHFPPNYIFISFVYLTLDDMAISRDGELLLKKAAIYITKKVGLESHKEKNILV